MTRQRIARLLYVKESARFAFAAQIKRRGGSFGASRKLPTAHAQKIIRVGVLLLKVLCVRIVVVRDTLRQLFYLLYKEGLYYETR